MKLMIAVPSHDMIHARFALCLVKLVDHLRANGIDFDVRFDSGTQVHVARGRLAEQAATGHFSHVLWLDADMVFEPDIFDVLYATGKRFVAAPYRERREPHRYCLFHTLFPPKIVDELPDEVFPIYACGFGGVLLETSVLRAVMAKYGNCFLPTADGGEDLSFCHRVRELGIEIFCEPKAQMGHIGQCVF